MTLAGVDVANWQGDPGQWQGAAGDISWAAVKITELQPGGVRYVNPDAAADWAWLKNHGKATVGYLFGHPDTSASETAAFFVEQIRALGLDDADAVGLDLEVTDGRSPNEVDDWAVAVLGALELELHRVPLLYSYLSFIEAGNCARLGGYPLWISNPSATAGQPTVPAPWKTWAIHQYQITGPIDRDVANFATVDAMTDALGKPGAAHKPAPKPAPDPDPKPGPRPPAPKPGPVPRPEPAPEYMEVPVAPWRAVNAPWNSTLAGIAAHEGTTVAELLRLNPGITDPNQVEAGTKVKVPIS